MRGKYIYDVSHCNVSDFVNVRLLSKQYIVGCMRINSTSSNGDSWNNLNDPDTLLE